MLERPSGGSNSILVQIAFPSTNFEHSLAEFKELASAAQTKILTYVTGSREKPDAKFYIGQGKAEEIKKAIEKYKADLVLINHNLKPSQERNLEKFLQCRVVDRTSLILDIFAKRAQSFEGKLQVELAQLQHLSTRLVRGWSHLERQKGGIGLRGPGETQLETDRRLIRNRIKTINKYLEKIINTRKQKRSARRKAELQIISLVGYTNAGKSTLFNALTNDQTFVANQLFATLDSTMRQLILPGNSKIMLIDTVGFISELPHQLVKAFRATLEETKEADLLLHVINIADPNWRELVHSVEMVLDELEVGNIPIIKVFNKIDQKPNWKPKLNYENGEYRVWLSALTGEGVDLLRKAITMHLEGSTIEEKVHLNASCGKIRSLLYKNKLVLNEAPDNNGGWIVTVKLTKDQKNRILGNLPKLA